MRRSKTAYPGIWPPTPERRRVLALGAGLVALLLGTGCRSADPMERTDWTGGAPVEAGTPTAWRRIEALQTRRVAALARFSSAGTLTLRWSDEDGDHLEQADHRLWRIAPQRAAVRISKVGSSLLLAGWNGERWWVLDETGDRRILRIHGWDGVESRSGADGLLSPPVLVAMLGLAVFPEEMPADFQRAGGRSRFTMSPIAWGRGDDAFVLPGSLVVEIEEPADGPVRLELRDDEARLVASARLERHLPVETLGQPPGGWPQFPQRVRISRPAGDSMVVSFDGPLAQGRVSERLFDLDAIIERSAPDVVERVAAGGVRP